MKKLVSLLAAVVLFPAAANANILDNVKLTGEIQTIASTVKNNDTMTHSDGWTYDFYNRGARTQALAGLSFDLQKNVTANLLFQYVYAWGDNNYTNQGFSNADGVKLAIANLAFSDLFDALDVTVGRQFYGEDGSAIIYFGPRNYNAEGSGYASALDAVTVRYNGEGKTLTLLAGKAADVYNTFRLPSKGDSHANILGADVKLDVTDALTANVYGYDLSNVVFWDYRSSPPTMDSLGESNHVAVYGGKLGWTADTFRAGVEYARNFVGNHYFKEKESSPYMIKADIAADINAITARGTFLYAKSVKEYHNETGIDTPHPFIQMGNYAPGLLIGHRLSFGVTDSVFNYGTDGVRMFNIGFDYKPTDKWTVSLDGFSFQGRGADHSATLEADLTAKYAHNEYVEFFGGVGYAKNGGDEMDTAWTATGPTYKESLGSENYKGQVGMLIKF